MLKKQIPTKDRLIGKEELLELIPRSYPTIWNLMREGKFPMARSLGEHKKERNASYEKPVWLASEIDEWIKNLPTKQYKSGKAA